MSTEVTVSRQTLHLPGMHLLRVLELLLPLGPVLYSDFLSFYLMSFFCPRVPHDI